MSLCLKAMDEAARAAAAAAAMSAPGLDGVTDDTGRVDVEFAVVLLDNAVVVSRRVAGGGGEGDGGGGDGVVAASRAEASEAAVMAFVSMTAFPKMFHLPGASPRGRTAASALRLDRLVPAKLASFLLVVAELDVVVEVVVVLAEYRASISSGLAQ